MKREPKQDVTLLLNPIEAARALSISPRTLWSLKAGRLIPHIRVGRSVRYSVDDLNAWIEAQKEGGGAR
jgi:excisionase family DNA binding protein